MNKESDCRRTERDDVTQRWVNSTGCLRKDKDLTSLSSCNESSTPGRYFSPQTVKQIQEMCFSEDEEFSNPIVEAFLKIGAIAEERRELLINGLSSMNNRLINENKKIMKHIQRQEDTICSLWQQLKSKAHQATCNPNEVILEQNSKLHKIVEEQKLEKETLMKRLDLLDKNFKETCCQLQEMKKAYDKAVENEKALVESQEQSISKEEYQELLTCKKQLESDLMATLQTLDSKDFESAQLKADLNAALGLMDDKSKRVTELAEEIGRLCAEKDSFEGELKLRECEINDQRKEIERLVCESNKLRARIEEEGASTVNSVEGYKKEIEMLECKLKCAMDETKTLKGELEKKETCQAQMVHRIKKLNFQVLYWSDNEKQQKERIGALEKEIGDMERDMKTEIEKYLQEISCLKQKIRKMKNLMKLTAMTPSDCSVKVSEEGNIKDCSNENELLTEHVDKVYSKIIERLTQEQIKCHDLVDRLHRCRLQFVMTQKEIANLRQKCSEGCNKIAIWARVVKEQLLTEEILLAEKEWKNSVIQSRALLSTLTFFHRVETASPKLPLNQC